LENNEKTASLAARVLVPTSFLPPLFVWCWGSTAGAGLGRLSSAGASVGAIFLTELCLTFFLRSPQEGCWSPVFVVDLSVPVFRLGKGYRGGLRILLCPPDDASCRRTSRRVACEERVTQSWHRWAGRAPETSQMRELGRGGRCPVSEAVSLLGGTGAPAHILVQRFHCLEARFCAESGRG